jgi:hypothetical protein
MVAQHLNLAITLLLHRQKNPVVKHALIEYSTELHVSLDNTAEDSVENDLLVQLKAYFPDTTG